VEGGVRGQGSIFIQSIELPFLGNSSNDVFFGTPRSALVPGEAGPLHSVDMFELEPPDSRVPALRRKCAIWRTQICGM